MANNLQCSVRARCCSWITAVILLGLSLQSSESLGQPVRIGAEMGPNFVSLPDPGLPAGLNSIGRFSWHAGLFVQIPLNQRVSVHPAIRFVRQGDRYVYSSERPLLDADGAMIGSTRISGTSRLGLKYLSIPVHGRLNVWGGRAFFTAGPELAYLLSATGSTVQDDQPANVNRQTITDEMQRLNSAVSVGIGLPMRIGELAAYLHLSYARGLLIVRKGNHEGSMRTSELLVGLGYVF